MRAWLSVYRIDTAQKIVVRLAPPALAVIMFAVFFPTEFANHWGKAASAVLAWLVVAPIVYVWIFRTLPEEPKPVFGGLSPFHTAEGRNKERAEQLAIKQRIEQLSAQIRGLDTERSKLDLTTPEGQLRFGKISRQILDIEGQLVPLKASVRTLSFGFTGRHG
ncbi:hypothetical protein [Bradyrhizobium sp. JR3.5]